MKLIDFYKVFDIGFWNFDIRDRNNKYLGNTRQTFGVIELYKDCHIKQVKHDYGFGFDIILKEKFDDVDVKYSDNPIVIKAYDAVKQMVIKDGKDKVLDRIKTSDLAYLAYGALHQKEWPKPIRKRLLEKYGDLMFNFILEKFDKREVWDYGIFHSVAWNYPMEYPTFKKRGRK